MIASLVIRAHRRVDKTVPLWIGRRLGNVDYHITQLLSGHGRFGESGGHGRPHRSSNAARPLRLSRVNWTLISLLAKVTEVHSSNKLAKVILYKVLTEHRISLPRLAEVIGKFHIAIHSTNSKVVCSSIYSQEISVLASYSFLSCYNFSHKTQAFSSVLGSSNRRNFYSQISYVFQNRVIWTHKISKWLNACK